MTPEQITLLLNNYGPTVMSVLTLISTILYFLRSFKRAIKKYENNEVVTDLRNKTDALAGYCSRLSEENAKLRKDNEELNKKLDALIKKQDELITQVSKSRRK